MSTSKVRGMLNKMLKVEEDARDIYLGYLKKFKNKELVSDLKKIEQQEELHVAMTKTLLGMLEDKK